MSIRQVTYFAAMIPVALGALLCLVPDGALAQSPAPAETTSMSYEQKIDQKARLESAADESSVRALADEIFDSPSRIPRMPIAMESVVKDRLVRAEIAYLQGGPGVREENIVQLVNLLADRLNVPGYAKTSVRQVRLLRMALAVRCPWFMARGMARDGISIGESIEPMMSPLQAAYLLKNVIDHKLWDADYQLTPSEWEQDQYQKSVERWRKMQDLKQSGQLAKDRRVAEVVVSQNPKQREIQETLSRNISSMQLTDALDLLEQAFTTLQIGR